MGDMKLEERIWVFTKALNLIDAYFAHWEAVPKLTIPALYDRYIAEVMKTHDRFRFSRVMLEVIASLKNGHSNYYDSKVLADSGGSLGFNAMYYEPGSSWIVTNSIVKELLPGDKLIRIDNMDTETFFGSVKKYICSSSERAQRNDLFRFWSQLFPTKFRLQTDRSNVEIIRDKRQYKKNVMSKVICSMIGNICYIKIPSFNSQSYEQQSVKLVKKFIRSKAIVLDIRNNSGGATPFKLISMLVNREWHRPKYSQIEPLNGIQRNRIKLSKLRYGHMFSYGDTKPIKPSKKPYKGKIALLIDQYTNSAAEDFAMSLIENRKVTTVGVASRGSNGNGESYYIGDGIAIQLGVVRVYWRSGLQFEGIGIKPHIKIVVTPNDLRNGQDPVLKAALQHLRKRDVSRKNRKTANTRQIL